MLKLQSYDFLVGQEFSTQIGKTLYRDFDAETYIPHYAKAFSGMELCIVLRCVEIIFSSLVPQTGATVKSVNYLN